MDRYFLFPTRMAAEKRRYKQMMDRVKALPDEYSYVFEKIQHYMWKHSSGSGMDMLAIFTDLIDLFESGAAEGKSVLEVTGQDVAEFADELLRNAKTYTEKWHDDLNRDIRNKLKNRSSGPEK